MKLILLFALIAIISSLGLVTGCKSSGNTGYVNYDQTTAYPYYGNPSAWGHSRISTGAGFHGGGGRR